MVGQANPFMISPNEQSLNYVKTQLNQDNLTKLSGDLELYLDTSSKRLATPWQVAELRTDLLKAVSLAEGYILDPACGAGIQLAALINNLKRQVIGIEIDESRARLAAANIHQCIKQDTNSDLLTDSLIICGDCTNIKENMILIKQNLKQVNLTISLLYLDPARPENSREHDIDEMKPEIKAVLNSWKPYLNCGKRGPAILLDLSPRLSASQQKNIESIIKSFWSEIEFTWQWMSRGDGRIDRLTLWVGEISQPGISRRFVRLPPHNNQSLLIVTSYDGWETEQLSEFSDYVKIGEYVSILDSALVASGLTEAWLKRIISDDDKAELISSSERRPKILHKKPLKFMHHLDGKIVQASGKIIGIIGEKLSVKNLQTLTEQAKYLGFGKITLRVPLDPEEHPKFQRFFDRNLVKTPDGKVGFMVQCNKGRLIYCETPPYDSQYSIT